MAQTSYTSKEDENETYCQPGQACQQHSISYRIVAVDKGGFNNTAYSSEPSDPVVTDVSGAPLNKQVSENNRVINVSENKLEQNYPNPFNPNTSIYYSLKKEGPVTLKVYDMLGREVAELVNEYQSEGYHSVEFNAVNLPSGIYIYQVRSGEFNDIKKMMLIK